MASVQIYLVTAVLLFGLALTGLLLTHHLIRKLLALNVMASAIFLLLVVFAHHPDAEPSEESAPPDPLPHALVLTGIVVSFSATALATTLARRIHSATGEARLPEEQG